MEAGNRFEHPGLGLSIGFGDVHIWKADLRETEFCNRENDECLSIEEKKKADCFYFERDKKCFIFSRIFLKNVLSLYLHIDPSDVRIAYGAYGKPLLNPSEGIDFNLAHSHEIVLCIVAKKKRVGIDVEFIRELPDVREVYEIAFPTNKFLSSQIKIRTDAFFRLWTRQEAYLKATGLGIYGLCEESCRSIADMICSRKNFHVEDLDVIPGYSAAFATEGHPERVYLWEGEGSLGSRRIQ